MNVLRNNNVLLVYVPEADIEIKMYPDTAFANPEIERTWNGVHVFVRMGEQAFSVVTTDVEHLIAHYDHAATRVLRAILGAERAARRDGVPQVVTYRHGRNPKAFFGPIGIVGVRQPGEPWVEIAPDGVAVWHNEE